MGHWMDRVRSHRPEMNDVQYKSVSRGLGCPGSTLQIASIPAWNVSNTSQHTVSHTSLLACPRSYVENFRCNG
ncbi:hypothetical protein Mapa_015709 [Marchantia paleacea]|nr:hypothetical protein Mapa_015709 [Marchantia paleacea]